MQKILFTCFAFCLISFVSLANENISAIKNAENKKHTEYKRVVAKKKKKSTVKKATTKSRTVKKSVKKTGTKKQTVKRTVKTVPQDEFTRNKGKFEWPMDVLSIKTGFGLYAIGESRIICNNPGLTLEAAEGATVKTIHEGVVKDLFQIEDSWGVIVQHGNYYTVYGNLASVNVSKADILESGTIIGKAASNSNGNSELEFLLMKNEKNIDPAPWFKKN
jgi:septal ring factor EnvC (AmiA/AmiB activator)